MSDQTEMGMTSSKAGPGLDPHIERVLVGVDDIRARIHELGSQISADYGGEEIVLVCILKGAFLFMSDLCRAITCPQRLAFMAVSSYGHSTASSGVVRIEKDIEESLENKHVLIVEDIVDTGLTLSYIADMLRGRRPRSLKICVLCNKPQARKTAVPVDYTGFHLPNEFVVGYGLDFRGYLRNLPYIGILKPEFYSLGEE
jgi:hypoxanthine phosphoribosyltransferase